MINKRFNIENKSDKKTFDKIVKALKDIKVRATIHLDDKDEIARL